MAHPTPWQPACSVETLRARAELLANVRRFFAGRGVLEVETPLLCRAGVTDPHLDAFTTGYNPAGSPRETSLYLQTSPEFAMKRLLAAGSGSIFQICKAFRNGEAGRNHNPEFTLLEWYRVGFSLADLLDEVEALFAELFRGALLPAERLAYADVFRQHVGADPLAASPANLADRAAALGLSDAERLCGDDRSVWLDLLFSHAVQPRLGRGRLTFVYDYPTFLPSLARQRPEKPDVVERAEVFLEGLELGNGFHELADAAEQSARFDRDLKTRLLQGQTLPPKDERLLAALRAGLPDCCGIAIGLDRMLMLLLKKDSIDSVLAFPLDRA
jgi:lysyl-tRNA synthetase class 2